MNYLFLLDYLQWKDIQYHSTFPNFLLSIVTGSIRVLVKSGGERERLWEKIRNQELGRSSSQYYKDNMVSWSRREPDHIHWGSLAVNWWAAGLEIAMLIAKDQDLIQAVKKECSPQKGYGEKRCEIQGGGQEKAVMVG